MSSKLMMAPSLCARRNSSAGVSFDENMISSPFMPSFSQSMSSVSEEQSMPQPSALSSSMTAGVGVALTAKYSLYPAFQANAAFTRRAFSMIPRAS